MTRRGPEVTEAAVAAFERAIGTTLPEPYRAFVMSINGGRLAPENRRFSNRFVVNSMYSLDDPDEARRLVGPGVRGEAATTELLPIAYDDVGNEISIAIAGEHRGEVWYWRLTDARGDDGNPRVQWHDRRDMKKLADSFDEFLAGLGPLSAKRQ